MADHTLAEQQLAIVLAFINERPRYVAALQASTDAGADYHRWTGGAEARRQLATALGLTVPHEPGETAEPALATVRLIRGGEGA